VFVTAHFDSTASGTHGWDAAADPAPGAGDDASGVVIALEVAQILALSGVPPVAPFRVVLFDGEEIGLLGSAHYTEGLVTGGGTVGCALNIDMVHATVPATEGRLWFLFDETSRQHAALGAEAVHAFVSGPTLITSSYPIGNADQASFWDRGLCAVHLSSWPRLQSNHTVDDTTATFDLDYFGKVARAAAAVVAAWAYYPPET
jgi:Zn-dependent M28 family amino/carboxypeptidase